jgi:ATP-binding cassette, subfamily B, bacterial
VRLHRRRPSNGETPAERLDRPGRSALARGWLLLPRTLHYLRPYRGKAAVSCVITVLAALIALAIPWPLALIVDDVLAHKKPPGWLPHALSNGPLSLIVLAVAATLLITLISGGLTIVNEYLTTAIDQRMVLDFRTDLFAHAQRLPLAFHEEERTGVLMYRINNQAGALGQIIVALPAVAQSLLTIIGMAYVAFRIDGVLAVLALSVVPFIFYSTTYYANRIEPRLMQVRGLEATNLAIVHEAMTMLRVVLAFGRERHEHQRFRSQGKQAVEARISLTVRQTAFQLAVQTITASGTAAVLGVGALRALHHHITPGELLVILSYIGHVYQPLETLTNTMTHFQQQFISLDMSLALLEMDPEVNEKPDAKTIDRTRGEVAFAGVSFGYKSRPHVLDDVSFDVPAGRAVAIVGPTGAGKSTLVSLLPRFYDPQRGSVRIDGLDVRELTLASLRAQLSIVLQEPLLFSGTIGDNIRYGKPGASEHDVVEAARAANAHDFITDLPKGYDTPLGEGGARISGGERQRIAVARAFLRDAPILILDEPTSSIDSKTEGVILDALDRLMAGRTTIMIAHRLSTIRNVDEIVVLDHGRLVERGSHAELLARDGLYRELWTAQVGDTSAEPTLVEPLLHAVAEVAEA